MTSPDAAPIHRGAVDVDGDTIVWVGPAVEAPPRAEITEHALGGFLIPGFVNSHCHTPMVLLRGAGEGLPVDRWLEEVMWPRESRLTAADVRLGMMAGGAELLTGGVTTSVEMYFHPDSIAQAAVDLGIRCVVTGPIIEDAQLSRFGTWEQQLEAMVALRDKWSGHAAVDAGIGPHAAYSVSDECLRRITEIALDTGMLVHIHVAEQEWEDGPIRERAGLSAPEYLESLGMLDARVLAAHGVWLTDTDIEIFARNDVAVAHCPCSNTKHASGVARVDEMRSAGVNVTIATDGPASHHRLDMFEEMRTAIRLARVRAHDAQRLPPQQALWMTTAGAAAALGRDDLGRLAPGCKADMVAVSDRDPAFHPVVAGEDDPVSRLVWSGSRAAVTDVWVAGQPVVAAGTVVAVDTARLRAELTAMSQRLAHA
jgi:5-methylthioadenosine/S-adenosylhomocysteine deaminase